MSFNPSKPAPEPKVPGCAFVLRFDEEGRATPGDAEDIERLGAPGEGFVWLHLDLSDPRAHALIQKLPVLTEEARKTLTEPVDRQSIHHTGNIVRGSIVDRVRGAPAQLQLSYLRFAFGEQFLVSARERPLEAVELTRMAISAGRLAETPLDLFENIVGYLCDELGKIVFELTATLDRLEERIVGDGKNFDEPGTLGATRRAALRLAREVSGLRSPLLRLEATLSEPEDEELKETGARLAQRVEILAHDLAEAQDRARLLQDELHAIAGRVTNDRLYILTVVTTVWLPASFVTGFFGMNTRNLPFADAEFGTAFAGGLSILAALVVLFFIRRMGLTRPGGSDHGTQGPPRT